MNLDLTRQVLISPGQAFMILLFRTQHRMTMCRYSLISLQVWIFRTKHQFQETLRHFSPRRVATVLTTPVIQTTTKPSLQGADVNLTPAGISREPRATRPKARPDSRPAKTPKNAAKARGSVGRQVREGQSVPPPPPPPTPPAPRSFQGRSQMAGALEEVASPAPQAIQQLPPAHTR